MKPDDSLSMSGCQSEGVGGIIPSVFSCLLLVGGGGGGETTLKGAARVSGARLE